MGCVRTTLAIGVAILAVMGGLIVKTLIDAGEFKTIVPHGEESCKLVGKDLVEGVEDIALDAKVGVAYFGSSSRVYIGPHGWEEGLKNAPRGSLWAYTLPRAGTKAHLQKLELEGFGDDQDLNPHGVSFLRANDGRKYFYVVNHRRQGEAVEAFEVTEDGQKLKHLWTAMEPNGMRWINDVHAVSPNSFYVTNWMYYGHEEPMHTIEVFGQRPWTFVSFCQVDGGTEDAGKTSCRVVADGLTMANGIHATLDHSRIFVVEAIGQRINAFNRTQNNSLVLAASLSSGSICDNLEVEPASGCLLSGCHPQGLQFTKHSKDPHNVPAPSQAMLFHPSLQEQHPPSELLLSAGVPLSASSTVVIDRRSEVMLIGAVFSRGFLECKAPPIDYDTCTLKPM